MHPGEHPGPGDAPRGRTLGMNPEAAYRGCTLGMHPEGAPCGVWMHTWGMQPEGCTQGMHPYAGTPGMHARDAQRRCTQDIHSELETRQCIQWMPLGNAPLMDCISSFYFDECEYCDSPLLLPLLLHTNTAKKNKLSPKKTFFTTNGGGGGGGGKWQVRGGV